MLYSILNEGLDYGDRETFVVGHKNPDTDSVCSAIAFAALQQKLGVNAKAMVSGKINNESAFVLKRFGVAVPEVLADAAGKNILLMDHSSYGQAVNGMSEAKILSIIDHHALGDVVTSAPLKIRTLPVGCTCTIVYLEYQENQQEIDEKTAGLMLSAILSDTVNLTSSTTTAADREVVAALAPLAGVSDLSAYFEEMADAAASYDGMSDEEIYNTDYKEFTMGSRHVGISQMNMKEKTREEITARMTSVLPEVFPKKGMDMLYALATDLENKRTEILAYGEGALDAAIKAFGSADGKRVFLEKVASRKKDVVPKLMEVIR